MKPIPHTMRLRMKHVLFIFLMLFTSLCVRASHIVGCELTYKYISGYTYKVTVILYADCGPASAAAYSTLSAATPQVCVYNGSTNTGTLYLPLEVPYCGTEITPVCPAYVNSTQCTNTSYTIPGIKKFVYSTTTTLSGPSHLWRFVYTSNNGPGSTATPCPSMGGGGASISGRAAAITNIAGGTQMQLIDTLDNYDSPNSSPVLTVLPTPFFCLNYPDTYNPGAMDPDADNLLFSLIPATNGSGSCTVGGNVTYTGTAWPGQPLSGTTPLQCTAPSFIFDQYTGQIEFFPNVLQRSVVVYNVREFRGGTFVGSCQREMTFLVQSCVDDPPSGIYNSASAGLIEDSTHFRLCSGMGAFSIYIHPTDPNPGNTVTVTASALPTGATFTVSGNGTATPHGTFSWNTTGVTPGSYVFYLTFTDNNCPNTSSLTRAFTVTIDPPPPPITGTLTVCVGGTTALSNTGSGTWSIAPTSIATVSPTGVVTGVSNGTAVVSYNLPEGCIALATVSVNPIPSDAISGPPAVCVGGTISMTSSVAGGTWNASGGSATIAPDGTVTGISPGTATISYTYISICGAATTTAVVTVTGPPTVAISGPGAVCATATVTLTATPAGGTWSDTSTNASISAAGVVTGVTAGTATITYAVSGVCGITQDTKIITVNPLPVPGAVTGPASVCVGSSVTLTSSGTGGTWGSSASSVASVTAGGVVSGLSAGTTSIIYTVTNGCGSVTANQVVTVNPLPSAGTISGPSTVCVSATSTLTSSTTGGTWSSTSNVSVSSDGVVSGLSGGTATITYTVTNGCGTAYASKVLTVTPLPVAGAIAGPGTVCAGSTIALSASGSAGTWTSVTTTVAVVTATGVVSGVAAGTTTISYTVTNSCGVAASTTVVTVNPLPTVLPITGPTSVCVGQTITLNDATAGGVWSSTGGATVSATGVVTGTVGGSAMISYAVTNMCGTAVATHVLTVNTLPNPGTITGPTMECTGNTITLSSSVPGGTWSSPSTGVTVSAGGVVGGITAGTATISYTVTNMCGSAAATRVVTVNQTPNPGTITGPGSVCVGSTVNLTASAAGGVWSSSSTATATISSAGVVTGMAGGTTVISYTVSTAYCAAAATMPVTVNALAQPGIISGGTSVCDLSTLTLSSTQPGGTWSGSGAAATISSTGVISGIAPGTVIVSYTVTNICGPVTTTQVITVNPLPDTAGIAGPSTVCKGASIALTDPYPGGTWSSSNVSVATVTTDGLVAALTVGTTTITYTRTASTGCTNATTRLITVTPLPDAGTISGPPKACASTGFHLAATVTGGTWSISNTSIASINSSTGELDVTGAGTIIVTYTTPPNSFGCINQAVFPMALLSAPPFYIDPIVTGVQCYGEANGSIGLSVTGATGPLQYSWTTGATVNTITNLPAGRYAVIVTDSTTHCSLDGVYNLPEPDSLVIFPKVKGDMCNTGNGKIDLAVQGGTAPYVYNWDNYGNSDHLADLFPGHYLVRVADQHQCHKQVVIDVTEEHCDDINVHNGISPNGDGINDFWVIDGLENYPHNLVQLFDKWGDKVYEQTGYTNHWDGKGTSGSPLPDGTYFYLVKLNAENGAGGSNVYTGSILIKR